MNIPASLRINHKCEICGCLISAEKKGIRSNDNPMTDLCGHVSEG